MIKATNKILQSIAGQTTSHVGRLQCCSGCFQMCHCGCFETLYILMCIHSTDFNSKMTTGPKSICPGLKLHRRWLHKTSYHLVLTPPQVWCFSPQPGCAVADLAAAFSCFSSSCLSTSWMARSGEVRCKKGMIGDIQKIGQPVNTLKKSIKKENG